MDGMSALVAHISLISTGIAFVSPTLVMHRFWMARRSLAWDCIGILAISSRKSVPPSACSNLPAWSDFASVNAPFTWPKSSLSKSVSVMAPASTQTIGLSARPESLWISCARTSLPVPFSPVMSTVASVGAIRSTSCLSCCIPELQSICGPSLTVTPFLGLDFLSRIPVNVSSSLALSHGLTTKSAAPRFIPSTANDMSA